MEIHVYKERLLHFPDKVKAATYFCYFGTLQAKCGGYAFSSQMGAPSSDFTQALFVGVEAPALLFTRGFLWASLFYKDKLYQTLTRPAFGGPIRFREVKSL